MFFLIGFPLLAVAASAVVAIDWTQRWEWVVLELFKRAVFALALLAGLGIACLKSLKDQRLDDRPAPWILWATLIGLGLFLVHNLIDFSLFEPGPMSLFAVLAGSALGLRTKRPPRNRARTPVVLAVYVLAGAGWIVAAAAGTLNVAMAEGLAQDAASAMRNGNSNAPAAVQKLLQASRLVPINPEYPFQGALLGSKNSEVTAGLLAKAIAADPASPRYRRTMAQFESSKKDIPHALQDYAAAVALDPNNMELRIEYAQLLAQSRHPDEARAQYQAALDLNNQLPPTELQRLSPEKLKEIAAGLGSLSDRK
jgi:tetratricopeptide (TPR) repeat protein